MRTVRHLTLYRKTHVLYNQVKWLYQEAAEEDKRVVLKLVRQVAVLRRHVTWLDQLPAAFWIGLLKKLYAPAIKELFERETMLYDALIWGGGYSVK